MVVVVVGWWGGGAVGWWGSEVMEVVGWWCSGVVVWWCSGVAGWWCGVEWRGGALTYELHPGIDAPGPNFFALEALAILRKNWAISVSDRLIFLPWSCSVLVLRWSGSAPTSLYSKPPSPVLFSVCL